MRKKRISAILGVFLSIVILAGCGTSPTGSDDIEDTPTTPEGPVTILNPLGEIDPVYNMPPAGREWDDFSGKSIALVYFTNTISAQAMRAVRNLLISEYDNVEFTEYNLGSSIGAKPYDYYETMASHDAVIIGVADCTLSAWWSAYHQKMVEEQGVPTVLLVHEAFTDTHVVGGLDNGFTGARRAVLDRMIYSRALTVLRNTDVDYLEGAFFAPTDNFNALYEQVKSALTDALTSDESNPPDITAQQLAGWSEGDPTARSLSLTLSSNEAAAAQEFNDIAMELGFGDGLPLIMPLSNLVDEMLAVSTREPTDVLGKIMPRGGVLTVEKVAINAVMAGARPEYFPAILAAAEAYASSWEDANLLYHSLTSSDNYSLMLLFSGPIVEELGISGQWGFIGSGNEASNAIGRAVRLTVRNVGVNRTGITDGTARHGRQNDHALTVFGEEEGLLPDGWERHNEMLGFDRNQSTVSLLGYNATDMYFGMGGVNAEFIPLSVVSSAASKAGTANVSIMTMPRNIAALLQSGLATVRGGTQSIGEAAAIESKSELLAQMGYTDDNRYLIYPVVVGDPESVRVYTGGASTFGMAASKFYSMQAFRTQAITGDAKAQSANGAQAPGAPVNVTVVYENGNAVLSWSAPEGAADGLRYQYTRTGGAAGGALNPKGALPETVAVSSSPPSPPFTTPQELQDAYNLGAWPLPANSYDPAIDTVSGIPSGTRMFGMFTSNYGVIPNPSAVTGFTRVSSIAELVSGTWLALSDDAQFRTNGFDYILVMSESGTPLTYNPAPLGGGSYEIVPSWIDVAAGEMSVTIPGVSESDRYYNDFWVRAVDDSVRNAVSVSEKSSGSGTALVLPPELTAIGAFPVGTWPLAAGSYDPALDGNNIKAGTIVYGLFDSAYAHIAAPDNLTGFAKVTAIGDMTKTPPTWYHLTASSGYGYILLMAEGELAAGKIALDDSASGRGAWARAEAAGA